MTDYTEADAAAEYVASGKYDNQYEDYRHAAVLAAAYTALRAELARVTAERDARAANFSPEEAQELRDILGCNQTGRACVTSARELVALWEKAKAERDEARQAAADWRLLAECCALRGVMQFLTSMRHINEVASGHDGLRFTLTFLAADSHRGDITRSLVDAARRLAAPHLNPPAEGGAK